MASMDNEVGLIRNIMNISIIILLPCHFFSFTIRIRKQISKKIKLHTQLSTHSPNNTLNLDHVINTDNENNTYIC